jgi:hypothetical protein
MSTTGRRPLMRAGMVLSAAAARGVARTIATSGQVAGMVMWWPSVRAATSGMPPGMPRIVPIIQPCQDVVRLRPWSVRLAAAYATRVHQDGLSQGAPGCSLDRVKQVYEPQPLLSFGVVNRAAHQRFHGRSTSLGERLERGAIPSNVHSSSVRETGGFVNVPHSVTGWERTRSHHLRRLRQRAAQPALSAWTLDVELFETVSVSYGLFEGHRRGTARPLLGG